MLKKNYNSLMMAKMIEISNGDMENAKSKLSKLIRDVNKCIALLRDEKQLKRDEAMTEEREKFTIKLQVGRRTISVTIPRDMEELYRSADKLINDKVNTYASMYPGKDYEQFLCMALIDIALSFRLTEKRNDTSPYAETIGKLTSEIEDVLDEKHQFFKYNLYMITIIIAVAALIVGGCAGFFVFRYVIKGTYNATIANAEKEADVIKEKKLLEVKEKFLNKKSELEKEVTARNQHIQQSENKLKQREISLNQRQEELGRRKADVDSQQVHIDNQKQILAKKQEELDKMQLKEREKLEELSGLSAEEAKSRLVESLKDEAKTDAQSYINEIVDDAKLNANQQAKKIVIQTIQRVATETAIENSVSVFHIENDEVKGPCTLR
eukprot:TRINITY_DN26921_c0_g1_i1.p1 TRINITY_DN26921_c0_g1~~TRINITY_DN26921_c0_g1_i1.p1  ORF type:complete len:381 (-),score=49.20 TRINITY_DN26921_c0_g1_i1:144-1286(-)